MTVQMNEIIVYKNEKYGTESRPFDAFIQDRKISFTQIDSSCWRGYFGKWEVRGNMLYLVELEANLEEIKTINLDYFFPGKNKVFADWFDGEIKIPLDEGEFSGVGWFHNKYLLLNFSKGILVNEYTEDDGVRYSLNNIQEDNNTTNIKNTIMIKATGIDLGTTNSVVAFKDTEVKIIRSKENEELVRSCVSLIKDEIFVGKTAYSTGLKKKS
jgi:hypothetical protein